MQRISKIHQSAFNNEHDEHDDHILAPIQKPVYDASDKKYLPNYGGAPYTLRNHRESTSTSHISISEQTERMLNTMENEKELKK